MNWDWLFFWRSGESIEQARARRATQDVIDGSERLLKELEHEESVGMPDVERKPQGKRKK
ncbi:MAG: hypothetical protein ABI779_10085 [Acidobacteriota bacterium]